MSCFQDFQVSLDLGILRLLHFDMKGVNMLIHHNSKNSKVFAVLD